MALLTAKRLAGAVAGGGACYCYWQTRQAELLRVESTKTCGALLRVTQGGGQRWLSLGSVIQSIAYVEADSGRASLTQVEEWTQLITVIADCWLQQQLWPPAGQLESAEAQDAHESPRALFLGVGGAVVQRSLLALNATISIRSVEFEPEVLEAAQRHFGLTLTERCTATVADASSFVGRCEETYDLIVVDCFTDEGLAPSVAGGALFRDLPPRLERGGLCLVNTWSAAHGEAARRLAASLCKTFDAVYLCECQCQNVPLRGGSTIPNVIVLCHQGEVRDAAAWRHALLAARPRAEAMCPDLIVELQGEQAGVLQRLHCVGGRKARACVHERAALVAGLSNSRSAVVTYTHRLCVCEP